jgi:hypothetical protein
VGIIKQNERILEPDAYKIMGKNSSRKLACHHAAKLETNILHQHLGSIFPLSGAGINETNADLRTSLSGASGSCL